jgi:hypothetical protein
MNITQQQLRRIIKEELAFLNEDETAGTENSGRGRLEAVQSLQKTSNSLLGSTDAQTSAVGDILGSLSRILGSVNSSIPGLESYKSVNTEYERKNLFANLEKIK